MNAQTLFSFVVADNPASVIIAQAKVTYKKNKERTGKQQDIYNADCNWLNELLIVLSTTDAQAVKMTMHYSYLRWLT